MLGRLGRKIEGGGEGGQEDRGSEREGEEG